MKNCYEIQCDHLIPMGKPGTIVAKVPVILTNLLISLPISFVFTLDKNYLLNDKTYNNFNITKIYLGKNDKLTLYCTFEKQLNYIDSFSKIPSTKSKTIKIPLNITMKVQFLNKPNISSKNHKYIFRLPDEPLSCDINYIKLLKDNITNNGCNYKNDILISINLSIHQVQDVFISEPECTAILLKKFSKYYKYDKITYCDNYIVGHNPKVGVVATKAKSCQIKQT